MATVPMKHPMSSEGSGSCSIPSRLSGGLIEVVRKKMVAMLKLIKWKRLIKSSKPTISRKPINSRRHM